ncbi:outer membrane protein OmpA-like peptidoglycan-associated protein [Sphingomonas aerophila]|uniref:Outer membrane protein OmpA-like peptidoglycan-associated protein n=1 Tax=Sphingomonas aerophila TaxID=1344948 RepID=A0A7W9EXH7_9SPHN|nr:outer membrane protein OmpA-like peptidoglycan-associated protein [Sphingomonas aerophila]
MIRTAILGLLTGAFGFLVVYTAIDMVRLFAGRRALDILEIPSDRVYVLASQPVQTSIRSPAQSGFSIFFGRGSSSLGREASELVGQIGVALKECNRTARSVIVGSASAEPFADRSDEKNIALAHERAELVKALIVQSGPSPDTLTVKRWSSFGQLTRSISPSRIANHIGRANMARRVDVFPEQGHECVPHWANGTINSP